ncbi:YitT family protein [Hazenella sp. IB182357]|uniref:YitT family protein n=1 Tax=Polycladospora coralii TaxID=2771432 RepID=A0A926NBY1_9BACL|nr:YitT family protein [Polycladospora coralii]MBD1372560.1 YitT family protein [Polycladospora coralii]MBS7531317.1 YitT family protein [Polycladospora coralii]
MASIIVAASYNLFLLPHSILSSGVTGISMIIGLKTPLNTGVVNYVLNLPLLIIGFMKLGQSFMFRTIFSVTVTSIAMVYLPLYQLSPDPIISTVFGGVIGGIGAGIIFRYGASTGGFDIIGFLITRKKDLPLGNLIFAMNAVVVAVSGFLFNWDIALKTMVAIFVMGKVVDTIHTNHLKLTLMIITNEDETLKQAIISKYVRGITIVDGEGAYTKEKRKVLFMIISRYELAGIKKLIKDTDPKAFVNITETVDVMGYFRRG